MPSDRVVRRRTVFYVSGFDPLGAARYHALYLAEAGKQSQRTGQQISVAERRTGQNGNPCWDISATEDGEAVQTRYEFLRWDDIVRAHWPRHWPRLLADVVSTTWFYSRAGALRRMLELSWPPFVALFAPFALLIALLIGLPLLALAVHAGTAGVVGVPASGVLALIAVAGGLLLGLMLERRFSMLWLMRSYAFTARQAQGLVPAMEPMLKRHAATLVQRIAAAQDDEVVLVGHSSGVMVASAILAQALRQDPLLGQGGPVVSLLTLGQCFPMLGCLPQAQGLRDDLQLLANAQAITWIDFSAPPDGCCFALVDPVAACGVSVPGRGRDRPKLLSPKFADMFAPGVYATLRKDKFRVHFQYLMASERSVDYDYFAITAGTVTLAARFASHPSVDNYSALRLFGK